jgi:DNA-binding LacI/PurR family transcriptional regulator
MIDSDIGRMSQRRSSRANSTDVARLAGVSIAAVSRAFKLGSSISPETAEKVFRAARQLKYVPNTLASSSRCTLRVRLEIKFIGISWLA